MVFFAPETCFVWDHTRARGCVSSEHTLNQSEGMYALFSEATCTYSRLPHNPYPIKCILLDKSHKFEQVEIFAFAKSLALFMVGIISAPYFAGTHFAGRSGPIWVMRESTVLALSRSQTSKYVLEQWPLTCQCQHHPDPCVI